MAERSLNDRGCAQSVDIPPTTPYFPVLQVGTFETFEWPEEDEARCSMCESRF
jgi:hypothetical protein